MTQKWTNEAPLLCLPMHGACLLMVLALLRSHNADTSMLTGSSRLSLQCHGSVGSDKQADNKMSSIISVILLPTCTQRKTTGTKKHPWTLVPN